MDGYKRLIRNPETRRRILAALAFLPDSMMLKLQYRIKLGRRLNLKTPRRFTEKLQWYKVNYRDSLMRQCVDKYSVRDYVEACGLEKTLNELYGVYECVEDINYDALPDRFVIKKTNGGGGLDVLICRDKSSFNWEQAINIMRGWTASSKQTAPTMGREWAYEGLQPRIIIERYLENRQNPEAGIADYKFFAGRGEVYGLVVDIDRYTSHKRNFYDANWCFLDVTSDKPNFGDSLRRPAEFEKMKDVASKLSEAFPFVRVDLYLVEGKVYFGELTFYPWSGYVQFSPDQYDFELGQLLALPIS